MVFKPELHDMKSLNQNLLFFGGFGVGFTGHHKTARPGEVKVSVNFDLCDRKFLVRKHFWSSLK